MLAKKALIGCIFMLLGLAVFWPTSTVHAAPVNNFPVTVTQPDGTRLTLYASGDEFYNWLHDVNGYTVIQHPRTGYYVYANLVNGQLLPTQWVVGRADPAKVGLQPYLNISAEERTRIRQAMLAQSDRLSPERVYAAPTTGTLTNPVIFIRFADDEDFTTSPSFYTAMFNGTVTETNSLRSYYLEASYNALTINSLLLPTPTDAIASYQDSRPRGYYQPYNEVTNPQGFTGGLSGAERMLREQTLLSDAINYVAGLGQFPGGDILDSDGDGVVDTISFIVYGASGEWSSLLWPHMSVFPAGMVSIDGKMVGQYALQTEDMLSYQGAGLLAHEMFHVLGAPDLYHYSQPGTPVGLWDLMQMQTNPPQHMTCYMKYRYGKWISDIPTLDHTIAASYTLNPLTSPTDNCYRINSPNSDSEYFVVEYRRREGSLFENNLPESGLIAYRINTYQDGMGNAGGPPDEIYVFRPYDNKSGQGDLYQAALGSHLGRPTLNNATETFSFLSDGRFGGLDLCQIGAAGDTLQFSTCVNSSYIIQGAAGVGGANLVYTDTLANPPATRFVAADSWGDYQLALPAGWSGKITPAKLGYVFTPSSRSYTTLASDVAGSDFAAAGVVNWLKDPGFEAFNPVTQSNPYWQASSTNFGTPLCTAALCGNAAGGAGPRSGAAWLWLGGTMRAETAVVTQTVVIPVGATNLEFYLWISMGGGAGLQQRQAQPAGGWADRVDLRNLFTHFNLLPKSIFAPEGGGETGLNVFEVRLDRDYTPFSAYLHQAFNYWRYTLVTLDLTPFADGQAHTLTFSTQLSGVGLNFNVDDVAIRTQSQYKTHLPVIVIRSAAR